MDIVKVNFKDFLLGGWGQGLGWEVKAILLSAIYYVGG